MEWTGESKPDLKVRGKVQKGEAAWRFPWIEVEVVFISWERD